MTAKTKASTLCIRMTPQERKAIDVAARRMKTTVSVYVRRCLRGVTVVPSETVKQ